MANTDLYNAKNEKVGEVELPGGLFGGRISQALLHEVSTITASNERTGTRATKGRGAVSGGGRKPWKQKGTGRARQGSIRSPQWRHGGIVFGPVPKITMCGCPSPSAGPRCAPRWPGSCATVWSMSSRSSRRPAARPRCSRPGCAGRLARRRRARRCTRRRPELALRRQQPARRQGRAARRGFALNDLVGYRHLVLTSEAAARRWRRLWAK